jgi:hypothetical protein
MTFAFRTQDDWVGIDLADPTTLDISKFRCPDFQCRYNHSDENFYRINVEQEFLEQFDDGSGRANFNGFVDRFGNVVPSCTLGLDCAPLILENVPLGGRSVQIRGNPPIIEYDLSPPGEWWIEHPN